MLQFSSEIENEIHSHALSDHPHECCGILIGKKIGEKSVVTEIRKAKNIESSRLNDRYLLDPRDQLAAEKYVRNHNLEILGFYHSHPGHPADASITDRQQFHSGYLYLIVSVSAGAINAVKCFERLDMPSMIRDDGVAIPTIRQVPLERQ
jgi:proteasome lid subunit RPN8/RPN11